MVEAGAEVPFAPRLGERRDETEAVDTLDAAGLDRLDDAAAVNRASSLRVVGADLITSVAALWLTAGLFVDGYAHENLLDTANEDFFTPYHAFFYSGFLALTLWVAHLSIRNRPSPSLWAMVPEDYRTAVAGLAVFGAAGAADAAWHQMFGVETGLDALLSPSHLFLMVGLVLLFNAPIRSSRRRARGGARGWSAMAPGVLAASLAVAIVAFFALHSWGLAKDWPLRQRYEPVTDASERAVSLFGAGLIVVTVVLFVAAALLRSWLPVPRGGFLVLFGVPNLMLLLAFGRGPTAVIAASAGALALEVLGYRSAPPARAVGISAAGGVAMWSVFFLVSWREGPILWPATITGGMMTLGGMVAGAAACVGLRAATDPEPGPGEASRPTAAAPSPVEQTPAPLPGGGR